MTPARQEHTMSDTGDSNKATDKDPQVEPQKLASLEDEYSATHVFPGNLIHLSQSDTVYRCSCFLKPEMLQEYYNPGPKAYKNGKLVLLGSPEFDGGFGTKWHLSVTFDRWIGVQRWISLYLTRSDELKLDDLKVFCELNVLDCSDKVVFSKKTPHVQEAFVHNGQSRGFTQFILFEKIKPFLIKGTGLRFEAKLTLLTCAAPKIFLNGDTGEKEDGSEASTLVDEDQFYEAMNSDIDGIQGDDQVALCVENEPYAFVNRKKLSEKSPSYSQCLKLGWDCTKTMNFGKISKDKNQERRVVREYAQFIHKDHCKLLEIGTYKDIKLLFDLARKMGPMELITQCLSAMTLNATYEDAAAHVYLLSESSINNVEVSEDVLSNFQKMFKENFKKIRDTQEFKELVKDYAAEFTKLAFSPSNQL